jgi:hypothetical protein
MIAPSRFNPAWGAIALSGRPLRSFGTTARQPSLASLGEFLLACRAVACEASEGRWQTQSSSNPSPLSESSVTGKNITGKTEKRGDARTNQGLVADEPEGQADQYRREVREPRLLCRLPDGRGRHPAANIPGDSAAHRGTAAAATTRASVRRSIFVHSRATDGRSAPKCQGKWPDRPLDHHAGCLRRW